MKKAINYLKSIGISILSILILNIFITLLQYFNVSSNIINFLKIFSIIISFFISSFILGTKSLKKGYLEGLKFGTIIIFILLILSLIFFKDDLSFKNILYYLIILISSIFGSMIGIQKKKD